jgi:AcrR family transcriptional regulator
MDRVRSLRTIRIEEITMRESNRDKILDGVVRLIERDGVTAVTFDAVAAETGITRGGIIYHFSSRDELILATHQHLARQWEAQLLSLTPDPDLPADRYKAYVQSCSRDATRAEQTSWRGLQLTGFGITGPWADDRCRRRSRRW